MESKVYTQEDIERAYKEVRNEFGIAVKKGNADNAFNYVGVLILLLALGHFTEEEVMKENNEFKKEFLWKN